MNYAFITGMGRSGTKFLTSLLSASPDATTVHEHIGNREFWLLSWYLPTATYAIPYLERSRKKIETTFNDRLFIDVNGMLQNCAPALRQVFSPVEVFHLVRDPREVVRSVFIRRNENDIHLVPLEKEELAQWLDGDKFYQVCWNWAQTTEKLLSEETRMIKLENVIDDFIRLKSDLLDPLGLVLSQDRWKEIVGGKVNATRPAWYRKLYARAKGKTYVKESLPPFSHWTSTQKQMLLDVCGKAMERCGYL